MLQTSDFHPSDTMTQTYWFIFSGTDLLLEKLSDGTYTIPTGEQPPIEPEKDKQPHHINTPDDEVYTFQHNHIQEALPTGNHPYELCPLRASYYKLPHHLYLKAGKCQEILYWDHHTQYCGVCGAPMQLHTDISKHCTKCDNEVWPQLATAVIVLVHRQRMDVATHEPVDEVLLVHARNFRRDSFGLVAGFVETGETLEEAVHREVLEETGITITNLRYFGSQPWPYPCGLMVGFHADYVSGTIRLQDEELAQGGWFRREHLPQIPEKLSIARRLIDDWLAEPSQ